MGNLTSGPTANTILNEVTGTSSTSMNGALEVAGDKVGHMLSLPTRMVFVIMAHLSMQQCYINNGKLKYTNTQ